MHDAYLNVRVGTDGRKDKRPLEVLGQKSRFLKGRELIVSTTHRQVREISARNRILVMVIILLVIILMLRLLLLFSTTFVLVLGLMDHPGTSGEGL